MSNIHNSLQYSQYIEIFNPMYLTLTKINPIEFIISLIFNNYLIENQLIENYIKLQNNN